MSFAKSLCLMLAIAVAPAALRGAEPEIDGSARWATFEDAGSQYFALSVQSDPTGDYPTADAYEVVVLMDTSATQTGRVRIESLEVLDELTRTLPGEAQVSLLACDVETVQLSTGLVAPNSSQWETAIARFKQRIPLGTTDLGKALKTATAQFSDKSAQRTIVYIGDGVNRTNFMDVGQHRQLVNQLVENQITVSALAIGPIVDVATLAAFANHTGGVVLSRSEIQETTQAIGRSLGMSTQLPVVWITEAQVPKALQNYFPQQFPPLRIDRDTIILGRSQGQGKSSSIVLKGTSAGQAVAVTIEVAPEPSNPDLGFLAAVTESASSNGGLTLPSLGSAGLRALSYVLADDANSMVKSGRFALKSGQVESAIRIAEQALKHDPNNAEAISLLNAAKKLADAEIPTGKFMQTGGVVVPGDGSTLVTPQVASQPSLLSETQDAGSLLREEMAMRRVVAQALEADVRGQLRSAQEKMHRDPIAVKNSLKVLMEELDNTVDVDATLRAQLRDQVSSAIQLAASAEAKYIDRMERAETIRVQADQTQRILAETSRRDESLKRLVEQFNFLMSSQRYLEASKDIAPEIGRTAPLTALDNVTREESSLASNYALVRDAFERREQGFVDAMRGVEEAAVPFDGNPPLIYPPPEVWQALSAHRKERYGAINLAGGNESEQKIYSALKQQIEPEYNGLPLQRLMTSLADELNIPIWVNVAELDLLGVDPDEPITLTLPPVSLRSALRLMLDPLELTYIVRNEVLEITSTDSADADPINKVYPVGDLVVPPMPMGGMMGGMGGGMGGMGGGMGGMGGGMGGMGGGMGGMGGGMFAVPDDSSKSATPSPLARDRASSSVDVEQWVVRLQDATEEEAAEIDGKIRRWVQQRVETAKAHLEAKNQAGAVNEFEKVIDLCGGLLGAGYPQPWMYQALSLSMEACDYPSQDIKRVLLSSLDFDGDTNQSLKIAKYLAGKGMRAEALELLKDVAFLEPHRYDVFALALPLAAETRDFDALRWVCVGIMSKAWPKDYVKLYDEAKLLAQATSLRLAQQGRVLEAQAFEQEIKEAMKRDMVVRVSWTGDADLDMRVKEPAGTVCSLANPQTVSGGILLGDSSSSSSEATINGFSEVYVCPQGYTGQYDVLIRKVYGKVSGGKATVEVYTDYGTPDQAYMSQQVELGENGAMIQVAVKNGHRDEPIAVAHLANVRQRQMEAGHAVLGQLGGGDGESLSSSTAQDYYNFRRLLAANQRRGLGFPVGGGAVGYRPVITTLPEGASMFVTGVVSADRRYVRLSPSPNFTGIGEIFTFNFVDGGAGTQGAGGGGFGGAGGGLGGGLGGAGGGAGGGGGIG